MSAMPAEALNNDNYYSPEANQAYWSASQLRGYIQCEARQKAIDDGEWVEEPTEAMLAGSYVHAAIEGTLQQFRAEHPERVTETG